MCLPCCRKDSSNNTETKCPRVKSTDKSLRTGFHVQALLVIVHIVLDNDVSGCVSTFVAGCVVVVVFIKSFSWRRVLTFAYIQQAASRLFGCLILTSAGTSLQMSFQTLLCFLACFFSPRRLCSRCFQVEAFAQLQPSRALLFFFTGKSCSSLFTLILKTALSLTLMRFGCFLIHSTYSVRSFLNKLQEERTRKIEAYACAQRVVRPSTFKYALL